MIRFYRYKSLIWNDCDYLTIVILYIVDMKYIFLLLFYMPMILFYANIVTIGITLYRGKKALVLVPGTS